MDGAVYVDDAYIGEPLPIEAVKTFVSGADVNIEVSQAIVGSEMCIRDRFKRDNKMSLFMRNLMDYDGKDVYEAMYVLCCIADRIKRKLKK